MNIKDIQIDLLKEYENNPRYNDAAVDKVAESIQEFGFKVPVIIDKNNVIIAGHTRIKAAKNLGFEKVPCLIADDLTPEQVKAFRLADNKVSEFSTWDEDKLYSELMELQTMEFNIESFGFDIKEININENINNEISVDPSELNNNFSLPDGDKSELEQITFTLHFEQAEFIKFIIAQIDEVSETFGNTNKNGNAIYEVVKQWAELKKLN